MNLHLSLLVVLSSALIESTLCFTVSKPLKRSTNLCSISERSASDCDTTDTPEFSTSRRMALVSLSGVAISPFYISSPASASGGATAGGAYLLSAKQRYNDRVTKGVTSYIALSSSLENSDLSAAKAFFNPDNIDAGFWKDFSSAGYLLSNAFRRSSSTAPDSLPSVQKWKAFAASAGKVEKAVIKKKSASGAREEYETSLKLLDEYLAEVELPSALELTK